MLARYIPPGSRLWCTLCRNYGIILIATDPHQYSYIRNYGIISIATDPHQYVIFKIIFCKRCKRELLIDEISITRALIIS